MSQIDAKAYIYALLTIPELSPTDLWKLLSYCRNDFERAFKASVSDMVTAGMTGKVATLVANKKSCIDPIAAFLTLTKNGIASISYVDDDYPVLLQEISQKPILLYYKGQKIARDELCIAVVGTRKVSAYGTAVTESITKPLAQNRITIVSGLAYGVDGIAHQTTLKAGGRTIAVVASGLLDQDIYPKAHYKLSQDIINAGGTLISEYPPGKPALKQQFIARNRIISGLSVGTLITECPDKSGALVTARFSLEQNRTVYAIPGSILETNAQGPNNLIKRGAVPVTEATDILKDLRIDTITENAKQNYTDTERVILSALQTECRSMQSLLHLTKLEASTILANLSTLELKGAIRNIGGDMYGKI